MNRNEEHSFLLLLINMRYKKKQNKKGGATPSLN